MKCREVAAAASDHVDGLDDPAARWRVRAHLALCRGCADFVRGLALTRDLLRRLPPPALDPGREAALVAAMRDTAREDGAAEPRSEPG